MKFDWDAYQDHGGSPQTVHHILNATLGEWGVRTLENIVSLEDAAPALTRFVLGPILQWEGERVSTRLSISNVASNESWMNAVNEHWTDPSVRKFLERAPASCRKMVDVGRDGVTFYLDDLYQVEHEWSGPVSGPLLCAALTWPENDVTVMTRHDRFPGELLGEHADHFVPHASRMPREGIWGVRWKGAIPISVLCVTEVKTRKSILRAQRYLEHRGELGPLTSFREAVMKAGLRPYLDSAELFPSGRIDLTLGILGPQ
jgi:hypothetical protein